MTTNFDVIVSNHRSVVGFTLLTETARSWVDDNVETEGWQWLDCSTLCVDWRFAGPLTRGMMDDGLTVEACNALAA